MGRTCKTKFDAFGILNAQGTFWTHKSFPDTHTASAFIDQFWGAEQKQEAQKTHKTHKIVPVVVTMICQHKGTDNANNR